MRSRVILFISLVALVILLVMLNFTTPTGIGPFGVLVFFTMVYLFMFGVIVGIGNVFRRIMGKKGNMTKKGFIYAAVVAMGPIILLLAQSFSAITSQSFILVALAVVAFVGLGCFLVNKRV